jgi:hypothetical protein
VRAGLHSGIIRSFVPGERSGHADNDGQNRDCDHQMTRRDPHVKWLRSWDIGKRQLGRTNAREFDEFDGMVPQSDWNDYLK